MFIHSSSILGPDFKEVHEYRGLLGISLQLDNRRVLLPIISTFKLSHPFSFFIKRHVSLQCHWYGPWHIMIIIVSVLGLGNDSVLI